MRRTARLITAASLLATAAAALPACSGGEADDPTWSHETSAGKSHDCLWVRDDPAARCNAAREVPCAAACHSCLGPCQAGEEDDAAWTTKDGQTCAWVAEAPDERCWAKGVDDRRSVEACGAACGRCVAAGPGGGDDDHYGYDDGHYSYYDDGDGGTLVKEDDFYADDDDDDDAEPPCRDTEHEGRSTWGHSCAWVALNLPGSCEGADARAYCPATCGACPGAAATPAVATNATAGEVGNLTTWQDDFRRVVSKAGGNTYVLGFFLSGALLSAVVLGAVLLVQRCCAPPGRQQAYHEVTRESESIDFDDDEAGFGNGNPRVEMTKPNSLTRVDSFGAPRASDSPSLVRESHTKLV